MSAGERAGSVRSDGIRDEGRHGHPAAGRPHALSGPHHKIGQGEKAAALGIRRTKTLHLRHRKLGNHTRLLTMPLHVF